MIKFTDRSYIIGMWYLDMPAEISKFGLGANLMGCAWREAGKDWTLRYRFRHYRTLEMTPAELKRSSDQFDWFEMVGQNGMSEAEVTDRFCSIWTTLAAVLRTEYEFFEIRGGVERMIAIVEAGEGPSWMNSYKEPVDERGGPSL